MCLGAKRQQVLPRPERNNSSKGQSSPTIGTQSQVGYLSTILVSISMKSCLAGGTEYPKGSTLCWRERQNESVTQPDSDRLSERMTMAVCEVCTKDRGRVYLWNYRPRCRSATRTSVRSAEEASGSETNQTYPGSNRSKSPSIWKRLFG